MTKLSIIIPVYNGEKYISNLLDELINQADNDMEVIAVENGSSDNTYKIISDYHKKYSFIKPFKSDKGVSKARNKGIECSSGKFIMFIDADDQLANNALKSIISDIKSDKDLYMYSFVKGKASEEFDKCEKIIYKYKHTNIDDAINWIISKPTLRASAWSKVYKKDLIVDNNVYFKEDLKYSEDSEFLLRYLKNIGSIEVSDQCIYKYVLSENSAMRSYNEERVSQYIKSIEYTLEEFKDSKYIDKIYLYILTQLNIIMVHDIFMYRKHIVFKNDIKKFKKIYNNSIFKDSLKHISIKDCFCKEFLVELMLKIKFYHIAYLLCYMKSYINQK